VASKAGHDETFEAAIAGIPRVAELIAAIPVDRRASALDAAERSYVQTALDLGYSEAAAQQWAASVMSRLWAVRLRLEAEMGRNENPRQPTRTFDGRTESDGE
jgi:hypothetical protein